MSFFLIFLEEYLYFSSLLILVLGIPGNILLFVMYSRHRLRPLSFSLYFRLIALVDFFITLNWLKIFVRYRFDFYIEDISLFLCKTISYAIYCAGPISSWHLIAISIDRLVSIAFPRRFLFFHKRSFQILVIIVIFVFNMTYYVALLVDFNLVESTTPNHNRETDNQTDDVFITTYNLCIMNMELLYWIDLLNSSVLPFIFMILTTSITIRCIIKSRSRITIPPSTPTTSNGGNYCHQVRGSLSRDAKFSLTSISLNVLFLVLNLPNQVFALYLSFNDQLDTDELWIKLVGFTVLGLFYANHAFGFYVQLAFNGVLRRETLKLLGMRPSVAVVSMKNKASLQSVKAKPLVERPQQQPTKEINITSSRLS